ncbi:hypothetical protein C8T65DRAFT_695490 [Cerioporus squamosus]|nr:hypothetical protein C8T65DRAFT_695490 [Cerioporus squamosus]
MNNGNPPNLNPYNFSELVPYQGITPEQYHSNMAQIQAMKEMLAAMEQSNIQAYESHRREQERQQLEAIAEQGRLAQQRLAQLNSETTTQNPYAPPVAGPSTIAAQYLAAPPTSSYNELPTSARIVEVTSSSQNSPQLQHASQGGRGGPSQTYAHYPQHAAYSTQTSHSSTSYATAGSSTSHYRAPAPAASATTPGTSQQQTHIHTPRSANGQTYGYPTSYPIQQRANTNHYSVPQPTASTSGQKPGTSSYAQPSTSRTTTSVSNAPRANGTPATQSAPGPSASSSTHQSDRNHATSSHAQPPMSTQSSSNAAQQGPSSSATPKAAPFVNEEVLYQVFRNVPPNAVQELMLSTYAMIKRQQTGQTMTAAEWEVHGRLTEKARQVVDTLTQRLKDVPVAEVREMFGRVYARLRMQTDHPPAPPLPSSTSAPAPEPQIRSQPAQPQPPSMTTPAASTQTQVSPAQVPSVPVSDRNAALVPQANALHPHLSSTAHSRLPQTQYNVNYPVPSQPPTGRPPSTNPLPPAKIPTPYAPANGAPTQVQWYKPRDPSAPMAFRNQDGQIQFIFHPRSQQASASAPATQTVLSTPAQPPPQTQIQFQTSTPQPSTPSANQQAERSWSPQKADRRRLAQDIIRSLGPPKGAFGTPLPPLTTPSSEVIELPTASGKRKPSPALTSPTPSKRQRVGDGGDENDVPPDVSLSVEKKTEQVSVLVAPLPPEPTLGADADADIIDLTREEADADGPVGVEQTDRPETIPVRAPSVTSSDAADAHQVQEAIVGVAPESSPGPSSPAVRTTKSPSLGAALEEVNRLHASQDLDNVDGAHDFDLPEESIALLSPTRPLQPSTSQAATSSPASVVRQKEKLPLFLPSHSSSPEPDFGRQTSAPPPTDDDDLVSVTSSALPRRSFGPKGKGKGKARQIDSDVEMASSSSRDEDESPRRKRRRSTLYVLAPPLPAYATSRRSTPRAASREPSVDELATCPVDEDEDEELSEEDKEVQAAAELSYSRLRETPCQWAGCDAVLNSTQTLQKHLALHAGEQDEWGSYACRWHGCLSSRFVDKVGLLKHLNKHALLPLRCAYEGCDELFDAPDKLLEHHRSSKHRNGSGVLRPTCGLLRPGERRRPLPPLPDVVPAYLAVPCRVSMHPISKERHQWLGGKVGISNLSLERCNIGISLKVLENIICFKWQGRRSNAAAPSRGSRRLAEKMAATELAGKTPAESLALIKRWIDGEYLDLTDGYDASRKHHLHCDDIGSGEVTKMVNDGLVLFSNEPEPQPQPPPVPPSPPALPDAGPGAASAPSVGPESASNDVYPEADVGGLPLVPVVGATEANVAPPAVLAGGPHDRADQLVGDVDVSVADGKVDAGGRLELPRRSNFRAPVQTEDKDTAVAVAGNVVAEPGPADLLQDAQLPASTQGEPRPEERTSIGNRDLSEDGAGRALVDCPSYISTRSAEVILSDVRPIKLKPEALHSVNVLLDEVLYNILSVSRSLATEKIKAALLKVLPTSLGKEALLEAEVELKAYWDRTGARASSPRTSSSEFDLQWSFELLRLKCEAYSTMNDSDEDAEAEKRLQQRMEAAGSTAPPSPALLAPAALYLTAILEAICEHVLSNVSRVAARDSSRTLATVQDLFIALGEDDAIYGMFKIMKVYEHIEALSKAQRPRRSKSFSRSTDKIMAPRTSTSSPMGDESTATPAAKVAKSTVLGHGSSESRRTSFEKAKGAKIFHARSLSDKHEPANAALARSSSEIGINREYPEFEEDEELQQEFDELMRSGATMKVSLTPDRLKSMEVYKQERIERERMTRRAGQAEKGQDGGAPTAALLEPKRVPVANGRRHVDSIIEDDEESGSSNTSQSPFQSNAAVRMRNTSFTAASSTPSARANDLRLRSISISNVPHPRHEDGIARKTSAVRHGVGKVAGSQNASPSTLGSSQFGVPKKKTKIQKSRESMDLDEVMNGSDGEEELQEVVTVPVPKAGPARASPSEPSSPRTPGGSKPHISRAAQDLIAFLDAGPPPDEPAYSPSMNASVISFESSKSRSGRLQRMMSRLTLGGSRESLNGSIAEEPPKTPRSLSRKNSKVHIASPPPPSFKNTSLTGKRSIPNVASASNPYPNVVVATPPPRPPLHTSLSQSTVPGSNTSSTHNSSEDVSSSQPPSLSRRGTVRKAVPILDDSVVSPSSSIAADSIAEGRVVNGNRHARVIEQSPSRDGTSVTSPISSPVARKPVILNGHPVKLDTSELSLHPRSVNVTSPTSTLDRKSIHAHSKAESGYASRSASRSPITPLEPPPPPPPPAPAISPADAEDLRRLLTVASSADECRLLVDMFLVKNGVALKDAPPLPESPTSKSPLEEALSLATKGNDEIERGLVALFLGGGGQVDPSDSPLQREHEDRGREPEQQQQQRGREQQREQPAVELGGGEQRGEQSFRASSHSR